MTEPVANVPAKKAKGRSPSYPSMALEQAIEKAAQMYDKEGKNAAPIAAIQEAWGYSFNTGPANMAISALKKYGLLNDEGTGPARRARLSETALSILHHPDLDVRRKLTQEAALTPPIHRELWNMYGGALPSNSTLRYELVIQRSFTETGAREFMSVFRRTIAYAGLTEADMTTGDDAATSPAPNAEPEVAPVTTFAPPAPPQQAPLAPQLAPVSGGFNMQVPLVDDASISIAGTLPLSEEAWNQFMAFLDVMKPSLTRRPE